MPYNNRILAIDDEEEILELFVKILAGGTREPSQELDALARLLRRDDDPGADQTRRFQVTTASQGEQGVALVRQAVEEGRPYSVVFVDMRMPPGWDGIRTIKEIHRLDRFVQIVVVTAYSDVSISEVVSRVGFTDRLLYLKKPFDDEEILQLADSLSMRWNLEKKVRDFVRILEGIFNSLADLDLTGDEEALRPFLQKILGQLGDFLDTPDVFLAKIIDEQVHFRVGLGRFANGITLKPAFQEIIRRVQRDERVNDIFRVDKYLVVPVILRSCRNVVVGAIHERQIDGMDQLLEVLAANTAKILDQGSQIHSLCNEVRSLKERERQLLERLRQYEARLQADG